MCVKKITLIQLIDLQQTIFATQKLKCSSMFGNLQERLESAFKNLKGEAKINDLNVANTVKDIRRALIDANINNA